MNKVLFLGAKEIGEYCLNHILDHGQCALVAVGGSRRKAFSEVMEAKLQTLHVPRLNESDEILSYEFDILMSVQYDRILKSRHLEVAKDVNVNLHMAALPEYRGCNQFTFAILDGKTEFGTTLHLMTEEADAGDILFERRFPMSPEDWVKDLHRRTVEESKTLFAESWERILKGDYRQIPQQDLLNQRTCSTHFRKEIEEVKEIQSSWPVERQKLHFRASYFPPFDPPVLVEGNHQRPLDMSWYENTP